MEHLILAAILGSISGIAVGVLPGFGPMQFLLLAWPLLQSWSPMSIAAFYVGLVTVSQYVDIIPSIFFGVPGEAGSLPTAREGPGIVSRGLTMSTIKASAIGRTVGCIVAAVITYFIISTLLSVPEFFSSRVQIVLFSLAILGVILSGGNSPLTNLGMAIAGYVLGMVGFNYYTNSNILTFGIDSLNDGLPFAPIVIGLYAIPNLWNGITGVSGKISNTDQTNIPIRDFAPTITRSSIIGYVTGLIPGLSYILSATASYNLERWLRTRNGTYQHGDAHSVVASETGNNVGAFSTLIPLFLFGIPITGSESLIYNLMVDAGSVFAQGEFLRRHLTDLILVLMISLTIGIITSWPLARAIAKGLQFINWRGLLVFVILGLFFVVLWDSYINNQVLLYMVVLMVSTIVGISLKSLDTLPFVFIFLMQNSIEASAMDFIRIFL